MIFIVKCVTITRSIIAYVVLSWKSMIFIVLSSLETVRGTVQYRYCIFSLLYCLLAKTSETLTFIRTKDRESTLVQCSVQYTLLLRYLMLVMSYCA